MLLAELGADVIRIDRPSGNEFFPGAEHLDLLNRGKRSLALDLKRPEAVGIVLDLIEQSHILVEGYRPGVAERLGLGPADAIARNPELVYGRMTGWGQDGPLSQTAGHDINYISITGALGAMGPQAGAPMIPLNLVGDFGGGSMYLVVGLLAALHDARRTGTGQVVDAAITDGAAHLLTAVHAQMAAGMWADKRGENMLDGGAPYYSVYETSDGLHMALGAIESRFFKQALEGLGLPADLARQQHDREQWPALRSAIANAFRSGSREHWTGVFQDSDACVTPVLSLIEAAEHPHQQARGVFAADDGVLQATAAPRFSKSPGRASSTPPKSGADTRAVLEEMGLDPERLIASGIAHG
jgi:alpha-methylacyl-CoA racemase